MGESTNSEAGKQALSMCIMELNKYRGNSIFVLDPKSMPLGIAIKTNFSTASEANLITMDFGTGQSGNDIDGRDRKRLAEILTSNSLI